MVKDLVLDRPHSVPDKHDKGLDDCGGNDVFEMAEGARLVPVAKHRVAAEHVIFDGVVTEAQRRHDVRPEEPRGEEDSGADDECSDVAPWLVVNAEPAVDAIPNTLPIADFKEGVDEAVYPVFDFN